mmetsp:Transcript_22605/g.38550  ORF Transcript_22605/g.38550 Transcript_22605/m.38550 type:complete len:681 (-) Transcript_22605:1445-3487(-)
MQMFRSKIGASLGAKSQATEEDYGDNIVSSSSSSPNDDAAAAEYWQVKPPSDDLDNFMWGSTGLPPPAQASPRFNKQWAKKGVEGNSDASAAASPCLGNINEDGDCTHHNNDKDTTEERSDNILSALEHPTVPDEIILEEIVWKQRGGFGKFALNLLQHEWEQRRLTLFKSGKLRYYELPSDGDMEGVKYDPKHAVDPDKSPWVFDSKQEPRGEMDLRPGAYDNITDHPHQDGVGNVLNGGNVLKKMGSLMHQNSDATSSSLMNNNVKVQARKRSEDPGPTPFEIDIARRDTTWRFCFSSQSVQIQWLDMLKNIAADPLTDEERQALGGVDGEGLDADHGFEPGDHIIRWEMLPIMYPIQIHGIVLEAGKNLVIIADFGLASYDSHGGASKDLNTWSNDAKDDSNDMILQAWENIKPKEKKRLNVIAVTDPKEIRKWTKIKYGDQVETTQKKKSFLSKLLPGSKPEIDNDVNETKDKETEVDEDSVEKTDDDDSDIQECDSAEPEWFQRSPRRNKPTKQKKDEQSVFSIDQLEGQKNELPKSDSAKLVLARTHFILENEHLLPPYHVFYSNSECIAVWAKTGRWSTLQAAVYLVSSAVGYGKSATMLTISVAAAHMILVPALAVGGLAVVGAPLLYLKKSQEKWEEATAKLTDKFWMQAEPEVFIEAIEYWGGRNVVKES